jgi:hypothetical protein
MSRLKNGKYGRYSRGAYRKDTGDQKRSSNDSELKIKPASDAHKSAAQVLREASKLKDNITNYPLVIGALRSEAIASPAEPQRPAMNGPAPQREVARLEYTARYQVFIEQEEEIRKQCISLQSYIHHVLLHKSFQKEFEQAHPDHSTMELREYIDAVRNYYSSTISSLPTQRRSLVKKNWSEVKQSQLESLADFRQTVNDTMDDYNSMMPEDRQLTDSEVSETFINGLNSNFEHLAAKMEREQMEKIRIRETSEVPTPYLDHTGYPPNLAEAYRKAREYEESQRDVKGNKSQLSSFATTQASDRVDKQFVHKKTGKTKSLKEMTVKDRPLDYDLPPCNKCFPRFPGNHFAKCHDEFMESIRKGNKHQPRPSKSDPKYGKKKYDSKKNADDEVKQAYLTLKKAAKAKEKAAKKAKSEAEDSSKKASQYTTLLSTFDSDTD